MAINTHGFPGTQDRTSYQYEEDYSDVWEAVSEPKGFLKFYDMVPYSKPLRNVDFYWMEDIAKTRSVTTSGTHAAAVTTITLGTGEAAYVQNGDLLMVDGEVECDEWLQVLTTDGSATITVERGWGGSTASDLATLTVLKIVRAREQGSEADDFEYKGSVRRDNCTGIISHSIKLDGSAMEGKPRGYQTAELDRQEAEILLSLKSECEYMYIYGPGNTLSSSAYGFPKGIRQQITALAGSNIGSTAVVWSYKQINERVDWLASEGWLNDASNLVCFCTSSMASKAGFWGAGACTRMASDRTYGFEVNTIHSTLGIDVPLVWSPACKPDEYMLLDMSRISAHPLGSRTLKRWVKPAGIDLNDYEARRLLTERGVRVRYADKAHFLQQKVTVR
jgi:hypothetical protein